jgi:hypothetical protein
MSFQEVSRLILISELNSHCSHDWAFQLTPQILAPCTHFSHLQRPHIAEWCSHAPWWRVCVSHAPPGTWAGINKSTMRNSRDTGWKKGNFQFMIVGMWITHSRSLLRVRKQVHNVIRSSYRENNKDCSWSWRWGCGLHTPGATWVRWNKLLIGRNRSAERAKALSNHWWLGMQGLDVLWTLWLCVNNSLIIA